mmetsp:Transcript_6896/g.10918  ORF Transcript_6896/g.10918 Transcript_6896/m.10918 type:complete len:278 (-) Transcript_6896:750-1583(-)
MTGQHLFHRAGAQTVACHVDDVIGARHDIKVSVLIHHPRIAGLVVAGKGREVGFAEPVVSVPKRRQGAGWQGQLDRDGPQFTGSHRVARLVQDLHVIAGHRHGGRADFDWQSLKTRRVARDGKARLCLPPVVIDRNIQDILRPFDGVRIGPFPRQIEGAQTAQIVLLPLQPLGVLAFDRANGRGCGEKALDVMLCNHPPERARIGRAHGLALKDNRRVAMDQWRIADIGVAYDPTDIGCGPKHLARVDLIDVLHRPIERNQMARGGAHNALGCARGA